MSLRNRTKIVLVVLALCAGAFWYGYIERAHATLDKDDWHIAFSYKRWACRVCSGTVESLTCQGKPVPIPKLPPKGTIPNAMRVSTPVGGLRTMIDYSAWRLDYDPVEFVEREEQISPVDLARGYYDVTYPRGTTAPACHGRKKGTPRHWCYAEGYPHIRWVDPQMLDKLDWITESLKLPGDK